MHIRSFCLLLPLIACSKTEPAKDPLPGPATSTAAPSPLTATVATTATTATTAGGLTWNAPALFVSRKPKSSMRVAEYGIDGDDSAELAVFYFGADQGGGVEANMSRWIGQFTQPDGSETKAVRSERSVRGSTVALVEAHGTYSGGMAMPGAAPSLAQSDAALLGAIVTGPRGSVFFKLVGPRATVEHARGAFDSLVESLAVAP